MTDTEREVAYTLSSTLTEAVLAGTIRLDAANRKAVNALLEGTGYRIVPVLEGWEALAHLPEKSDD